MTFMQSFNMTYLFLTFSPYVQMSSYNNRNPHAQRTAVVDYDRQFQEDLERAQALSLESLALEKFRLQMQQTQHGNRTPQSVLLQSSTSCGSNAVSETDGSTSQKYVDKQNN